MTAAFLVSLGLACFQAEPAPAEIVSVKRVWDKSDYSAFTDLIRHEGRWFMTFREGAGHVSPDGAIRVLSSTDGEEWNSLALITSVEGDLRDPKLSITPFGQLLLAGAIAYPPESKTRHQSLVWVSDDGEEWQGPHRIGDPNYWLWRPAWHKDEGYVVGYSTVEPRDTRLYHGKDGKAEVLAPKLFVEGFPNEAALAWLPDDTALCLLRRDGKDGTNQLGTSKPPYTEWTWKDLGQHLGGPALLRLADGRFVAGGRLHKPNVHTGLCWIDPEAGTMTEFLALPSNGDSSYPGLVEHDGELWVSYYSGHEGKTSIYLARIKLPKKAGD
ncbi:sialidase family protein [Paludisphaera sp.]|uniref:sialidase family protein n=1 Tax=Paludisphaera sp. TaxID=2017432 RepID=UPI00301C6665